MYSRALRCLPLPGPRCSCRPAATSLSPRPSRRIPRSRISCLARRSLSLTDTPRPAGTGVRVSRLRPCWPSLTRSNSSCARRPRPPRTSIWGRVQSSRVGPRGRNEGRWAGPSETWPSPQARRRWRGFAVSLLGDRLGRVRAIACAPIQTIQLEQEVAKLRAGLHPVEASRCLCPLACCITTVAAAIAVQVKPQLLRRRGERGRPAERRPRTQRSCAASSRRSRRRWQPCKRRRPRRRRRPTGTSRRDRQRP